MRALSPSSIRPPLANYSHGIAVPAGNRLVITAGQLGIAVDESIPEDSEAQADICFANIAAILAEDGMTMSDVVRLSVYVTGREHMQGYRRSRDRQFPKRLQPLPSASTATQWRSIGAARAICLHRSPINQALGGRGDIADT